MILGLSLDKESTLLKERNFTQIKFEALGHGDYSVPTKYLTDLEQIKLAFENIKNDFIKMLPTLQHLQCSIDVTDVHAYERLSPKSNLPLRNFQECTLNINNESSSWPIKKDSEYFSDLAVKMCNTFSEMTKNSLIIV